MSIFASKNQSFFRSVTLLAGLCLSLAMAGCTTGPPAGGDKPGGAIGNGGAQTAANVLRQPLTTEPTTLDPAKVEDGTTIDLLQQVFEGLVRWGEDNSITPSLAEKWEVSPDGRTYVFFLKKGVTFHNGREMTAEDFKYSFERACDPNLKSPVARDYLKDIVGVTQKLDGKANEISGIRVKDSHTLQITIDSFKPYWLGNMTYPCSYVVCKEEVEKNKDASGVGQITENQMNTLTGTGPFKFSKFERGYQISLVAYPDYHGGKPKLDGIERPIIKDATQRMAKYVAGELDIVVITPADLDRVNSDEKLKSQLKTFQRAATWYIGLNQAAKDSPFINRDVRRAFAMAIDKDEVIRVVLKGQAEKADGIIPPGVPGRNEAIRAIPFDPTQAKQLLAKAGYPSGANFPTLTFSFRQDQPEVGKAAEVIAQQLKTNLGIHVQLRPMEWAQFLKERTAKTMPLSHLRWAADYLDPQNFLSVLLHTSTPLPNGQESHPQNGVGYNNKEFDALCDQADGERDPKKRFELYNRAEQIAVDDAPWVPIYFQRDLELIHPRVKNLRDSLAGHLPHITTTVTE